MLDGDNSIMFCRNSAPECACILGYSSPVLLLRLPSMRDRCEDIDYIEGGVESLDLIAPLWAELTDHHRALSEHFAEAIAQRTFAARKAELAAKGGQGHLRVDLARISSGEYVGYCVSTIDGNRIGEVDSIFVQPPVRKQGIGDALMRRAMRWMEEVGTQSRIVEVAWGNNDVWSFYQRYGFLPRSVRLVQRPPSFTAGSSNGGDPPAQTP